MKITFLGTGTSTGVPKIGCECSVCTSDNPKNKRLRSSILVENNSNTILVDTSTDLRIQSLNNHIKRINTVLFTHSHADHVHGIDELRSFNFIQQKSIPCYGNRETINNIRRIFSYIFNETQEGGGKPKLDTYTFDSPMELFGIKVACIDIMHGSLHISGYRFNNTAYLTDCSFIPDESKKQLTGLELLILGVLRFTPHPTHFSIEEALQTIQEIKPDRTLFTHIHHNVGHNEVNKILPHGVELAYDGMVVDWLT